MPISISGDGPITGITSLNTTVSSTELGYLDGTISAIQTQLNTKPTGGAGIWTSFTPTITGSTTNPNIGSTGTAEGAYTMIGKAVFWRVCITPNGTGISAGSGGYAIAPPVSPRGAFPIIATGWIYNGTFYPAVLDSVNGRIILTSNGAAAGSSNTPVSAFGHVVAFSGTYEAA